MAAAGAGAGGTPLSGRGAPGALHPPGSGRLLAAVDSIWILRGDGTVEEERSKSERGRWLTRTLQGPWEDQTDLV
jgi:hypothetical protein